MLELTCSLAHVSSALVTREPAIPASDQSQSQRPEGPVPEPASKWSRVTASIQRPKQKRARNAAGSSSNYRLVRSLIFTLTVVKLLGQTPIGAARQVGLMRRHPRNCLGSRTQGDRRWPFLVAVPSGLKEINQASPAMVQGGK